MSFILFFNLFLLNRLLAAADKYDLQKLKQMCEESLLKNLNTGNVLEMLVLSDLHGAPNLRSFALQFIVENGPEIVSQDGWKDTLKKYPEIVVDLFEATTKEKVNKKRLQNTK